MTFEQILKEHDRDSFARGLDQGRAEGEAAGLERGRSEGEAIGLEKGRNEGAVQEKREIAKNLKGLGIALKEIVKATGLSETEVAKL